jgi:hypothetical protein
MLSKLGKWLISRFPEKKVVTPEEYQTLLQRVSTLEQNSVHKDAVKTIVLALKDVKDEFQTVKTGLGLATPRMAEVQAMLNGQMIGEPNE